MIEDRTRTAQGVRGGAFRRGASLGMAAGLAFGCDGQADPSYRGEPLMTVSGQVEAGLNVGEVEVGVLWVTSTGDFSLECTGEANASGAPSACAEACGEVTCETLAAWEACVDACPDVTFSIANAVTPSVPFLTGGVGQTTPAVGEFPAQFSLDILEPPPDEALIASTTGERLAIGLFVVVNPGSAPFRFDLSEPPDYPEWLLGGSDSHMLVYSPDGLTEDSLWSQASGLTFGTGFHLIEVTLVPEDSEEDDTLVVVPGGDASQVGLRIASPDSIAWPLLF
jgi:hypothetical protein